MSGLPFLLAILALVGLISGCGDAKTHTAGSRELALQRAQFAQVSAGLLTVQGAIQREVSASRRAWPQISNGLPPTLGNGLRSAVNTAGASAKALAEPSFSAKAGRLTGPAAGLAGLYQSYSRLAERGWRLTETGIAAIGATNPQVAAFARENSSLYIDAIYDAHFNLSLLGKSLETGYERLGGPQAFGATLTQSEIDALATAYSIPAVRLEPHPGHALDDG